MNLREFYFYVFKQKREFKGTFFLNPISTSIKIFSIILFIAILMNSAGLRQYKLPFLITVFYTLGHCLLGSFGYLIVVPLGVTIKNKTTIFYNYFLIFLCVIFIWGFFYLYNRWTVSDFINSNEIREKLYLTRLWQSFLFVVPLGLLISYLLIKQDFLNDYRPKDKKRYKLSNKRIVLLKGKNKNESVKINIDLFIYAASRGHYVTIYYIDSKKYLKTYILRNSIAEIKSQLDKFSFIDRCHRSYIINIKYLKTVIGNSNKSHIYLYEISQKIPLSKNKFAFFKDIFGKMKSSRFTSM